MVLMNETPDSTYTQNNYINTDCYLRFLSGSGIYVGGLFLNILSVYKLLLFGNRIVYFRSYITLSKICAGDN